MLIVKEEVKGGLIFEHKHCHNIIASNTEGKKTSFLIANYVYIATVAEK